MIEVGHHRISQLEVVWREDELVSPSAERLQLIISTHRRLDGTHRADTHHTDMMALALGLVSHLAGLTAYNHLLRAHLVLGQVLHFNRIKAAETTVNGDETEVDAIDFQTFHQLTTEVHA